ncbi:MAG: hypothetical protein KAX80_05590 [Planctomycetes bacterium]|nr:hypothetical protein [Planctomycetota bacterium]
MAAFLWSLVMLILGVGFGGFYLLKQLGWFGGLSVERWGSSRRPAGWSRWRRRLTAVLLMALGVLCFVGVNWLGPKRHPIEFLTFVAGLAALCLVVVLLAWQDFREVRRLGRRLWMDGPGGQSRPSRKVLRQLKKPGGNGGSQEEMEEP